MSVRIHLLLAIAILSATPALADNPAPLRVYVPRSIAVNAATLRLDAVCVVQCQDETLAKAAAAVELGRSPLSGEKIVIDRKTILSQLAAASISAARVEFTGTEQVSVTRGEQAAQPQQLVQAAEEFLHKGQPGPQGAIYQVLEAPKALVVMGTQDELEFRPRLAKESAAGTVKVEVVVAAGGKELGSREVTFKLAYPRKDMVATRDIPAGSVVTPENAKIQVVPSDQSSPQEPAVPFGATLAAAARQGAVLQASMLRQANAGGAAGPAYAVRRNQNVVMKIQTAQFTISSVGLALQDGRAGEVIKVQNADTRKVVNARIAPDGTVSPLFEEKPS
jgi:flagella basal body P-ring formation protein FlgA